MKLDELKTLTSMTWEQVRTKMQEKLPDDAYRPIEGVAGNTLTDINSAYMIEVITDCFGPCGIGWGLNFASDNVLITDQGQGAGQNRFLVSIQLAEFWYVLGDTELPIRILTSGGSTSQLIAFAIKGAQTSAIGAAVSRLLFQLEVYKGHHDAILVKRTTQRREQESSISNENHFGGATKKQIGYIYALLKHISDDWKPKKDIKSGIDDLVRNKKMTFENASSYIEQLKETLETQTEIGV